MLALISVPVTDRCCRYLKEALASGHLDGDRGGEADHGRAAQPHVRPAAAAALLRALLAPDGERPAGGPAGDAALVAGGDAQWSSCMQFVRMLGTHQKLEVNTYVHSFSAHVDYSQC